MSLQKYTRADEAKIKDLTLTTEKLTKEVQKRKNELDAEVCMCMCMCKGLIKSGKSFFHC